MTNKLLRQEQSGGEPGPRKGIRLAVIFHFLRIDPSSEVAYSRPEGQQCDPLGSLFMFQLSLTSTFFIIILFFIQTHKRFKRTLFMRTKHNTRIIFLGGGWVFFFIVFVGVCVCVCACVRTHV